MADPRTITIEHDGLRIAALDWGGDGPPLLLQHPNGFCAGFFDPLARELRGEYHPIGVDVRGHGASERPADLRACTFPNVAGDVFAVLDALGFEEIVVLGHSMGGAVAILLDEIRPGIVRKALLCEAIAFPSGGLPLSALPPSEGGGLNPMAEKARGRRAVWPDRETARASYASRPPMDVLEPAALAAYLRYGFHDRDDGEVELACAPEVEARCFEAAAEPHGAPHAFAHLPKFRGSVVVASGDHSNLPTEVFAAQAEAVGAPYLQLDGGHFFPQENTARTAALVREHLA
ncbi:MAG: alpha/beta hydrolase [Acidimicrobiia bacterium]